jgi:hypothetical protein
MTQAVTGVYTGLLYVLHYGTDIHVLTVAKT